MTVSTSPTALAPAPSDRRKPGRPRSEQADQAIVAATLELLAEGTTVGELSIETVAQRAGVGKATIYRRWHNKEALLIDSLKALHAPLPECASCGTARDDLIELMTALAQATDESLAGRIFPCMMAEKMRSPELAARYNREVVEPRREQVRMVLRRGMASGELRTDIDVDLAVYCLTAPLFMRAKLDGLPTSRQEVTRLVDMVLAGIGAARQAVTA